MPFQANGLLETLPRFCFVVKIKTRQSVTQSAIFPSITKITTLIFIKQKSTYKQYQQLN